MDYIEKNYEKRRQLKDKYNIRDGVTKIKINSNDYFALLEWAPHLKDENGNPVISMRFGRIPGIWTIEKYHIYSNVEPYFMIDLVNENSENVITRVTIPFEYFLDCKSIEIIE